MIQLIKNNRIMPFKQKAGGEESSHVREDVDRLEIPVLDLVHPQRDRRRAASTTASVGLGRRAGAWSVGIAASIAAAAALSAGHSLGGHPR